MHCIAVRHLASVPSASALLFIADAKMSVTLHTTLGDMKIELACAEAPASCANFLGHCGMGTYVGTKFHRNIAGFCVQGGDPTGTGKGGKTWNDKEIP